MTQQPSTVSHVTPMLYDWEDKRQYNARGDVKSGMFHVKGSTERYGMGKHTDDTLRQIFAVLSTTQLFYMLVVRMPIRIARLLQGNFIYKGIELAKIDWLARNSKLSQAGGVVGKTSFYVNIVARSLWELVKEIGKIATYPLAIVALEFASFYGRLIHPLDGQKMWSDIEYAWSSNLADTSSTAHYETDSPQFLGACMQPKSVWEEQNVFRVSPLYDPRTIRFRILTLKNQLHAQKSFLEQEGLDVVRILDNLRAFKITTMDSLGQKLNYFKAWVSQRDRDEFDCDGNFRQCEVTAVHADILEKIQSDLTSILTTRLAIISAQRALSNTSGELNSNERKQLAEAEKQRNSAVGRLNHFCDYWKTIIPKELHKAMGCTMIEQHRHQNSLRAKIRAIKLKLNHYRDFLAEQGVEAESTLDKLRVYTTFNQSKTAKPYIFFKNQVSWNDFHEQNYKGQIEHTDIQKRHAYSLDWMSKDIDTIVATTKTGNEIQPQIATGTKDTKLMKEYYQAQYTREYALQRLQHPCLYWRKEIPLEMHRAMECESLEVLCYSNQPIEMG